MARPDFPLSIHRRRMLTSAAAATATSILPDVKGADAAGSDFLHSSRLTPKIEPANFLRRDRPASFGDSTSKRHSPGGKFAFAFDCEGIAPDEEAGRIGGVSAGSRRRMARHCGRRCSGSSRSGGQPKLAAKLDGGSSISKRNLQNSPATILCGTPRGLLGRSGSITRHSESVRSYRLMRRMNLISP